MLALTIVSTIAFFEARLASNIAGKTWFERQRLKKRVKLYELVGQGALGVFMFYLTWVFGFGAITSGLWPETRLSGLQVALALSGSLPLAVISFWLLTRRQYCREKAKQIERETGAWL